MQSHFLTSLLYLSEISAPMKIRIKAVKAHRVVRGEDFPHFLDSWLTDGGEVVSLTHWLPITLRKIPGAHFF
jgi:hypothetical protein